MTILAASAVGQTALRSSLSGTQAADARAHALSDQPYNLDLGLGRCLLSAAMSMELNDNVQLADQRRLADVVLEPTAGVFSLFPLSERNALRFDLAMGWRKFIEHDEYSALTIRPGSELGLDVFVGDIALNVHSRLRYTTEPLEHGAVSGVAEFGGLDNSSGSRVTWSLNQLLLMAGYDHSWFLSSVSRFDYLTREADAVSLQAKLLVHEALSGGGELAGGWNRYTQPLLNNSLNASAGGFLHWSPSFHIDVMARGGCLTYQFASTGLVGPTPDQTGYYMDLRIDHRVNATWGHSVSALESLDLGINADLQRLWRVAYEIRWDAREHLRLVGRLQYEHGSEEGARLVERYGREGFGLSGSYRLSERLSLQVGYEFNRKKSDFQGRDYTQNRVTVSLAYRL